MKTKNENNHENANGTAVSPGKNGAAALNSTNPPQRAAGILPADLTNPDPDSLTPLPGESARAFEAFRVYLDLGARRRLTTVARQTGVTPRTVRNWAARFDWYGRVRQQVAHNARTDAALQQEEQLNVAALTRGLRDRQVLLADSVLHIAERCLERIADEDFDQMRLSDICRALDVSSRFLDQARQNLGPDTSVRDQLSALLNQMYPEPKTKDPAPASAPGTAQISS